MRGPMVLGMGRRENGGIGGVVGEGRKRKKKRK